MLDVSFGNLEFINPEYLNFLYVPVLLFIFWFWRFFSRRGEVKKYQSERRVPVKEKYLFAGKLVFWLFLIMALSFSVIALSRPTRLLSVNDDTSIDLIFIFDGSASMRVKDLKPDRWQRSMVWLQTVVETLAWKGDRVALALFASKAYPYVRLTDDPNVILFFINYLKKESPLKLEDPKTWDTNIEEGIYWGVKILAKDYKLYGPSKNPIAFVLVSDGQAWSGSMEAIFKIIKRIAPVYVVGVGTSVGGVIPEKNAKTLVNSAIDRDSLRKIAATTGGEYFELGSDIRSDKDTALKIINSVRKRKLSPDKKEITEELYWYFILAAGISVIIGTFYLYK